MVRYIVISEHAETRERVIVQIMHRTNWQLMAEYQSVNHALPDVEFYQPVVCFIESKNICGDLSALTDNKFDIQLVVLGQDSHCAVAAFEHSATDFLLKPLSYERVEQTLDKIEGFDEKQTQRQATNCEQLAIKSLGKIELINVNDIYWIRGASNYVELHLADRVVLHRETMKHLLNKIEVKNFVQVHRCSIVNLDRIKMIHSEEGRFSLLNMTNGEEVRISQSYRKALLEKLGVSV